MTDLSKIYVEAVDQGYCADLGANTVCRVVHSSVGKWLSDLEYITITTNTNKIKGNYLSLQCIKDKYEGDDFSNLMKALRHSDKYGRLFREN